MAAEIWAVFLPTSKKTYIHGFRQRLADRVEALQDLPLAGHQAEQWTGRENDGS
jgi:hypothetical protein